jgi:hypothetical protein
VDFSTAPLTEPDMRARIRLFGSIDQSASSSSRTSPFSVRPADR